jgi:hypothetical protein
VPRAEEARSQARRTFRTPSIEQNELRNKAVLVTVEGSFEQYFEIGLFHARPAIIYTRPLIDEVYTSISSSIECFR